MCYQDLILFERRDAISLRVCTLASGSKGNCIYVEGDGAKVLFDCGLTMRETKRRLSGIGVSPSELSAVVITHEHTDHIKGVGALCRAFKLPVYVTAGTYKSGHGWLGKGLTIREFEAGSSFDINGLTLEPFTTPHDAADPVGFAFYSSSKKGALATDLGYATHLVTERLKGANIIVLESNHDPGMLKDGPYPWYLKQRVAGKQGHLSNEDAGRLLECLLHDGLTHVILAHLSQINNLPELAHEKAMETLAANRCECVRLGVASQDFVGEVFEV
jgi:phosphoribosyl 1,2-cyclic phosphodiesterase